MEIVIEIPDTEYEAIKDYYDKNDMCYLTHHERVIAKGTPLPKGHGRIADIDKVLEEMRATRTYDIPFALDRVKPIIEADNAESEDNE